MKTTHQLSIQVSKTLFIEKTGLVIRLLQDTRVSEAVKAQLKPLLIYSINVENIPGRFVQFSPLDDPVSLAKFIQMSWSEKNKEGKPHELKVTKVTLDQFPWLIDFTEKLEVKLIVADGKDRAFNANQRFAQDEAESIQFSNRPDNENKLESLPVISDMNKPQWFQKGWIYPFTPRSQQQSDAISNHKQLKKEYPGEDIELLPQWNDFPSNIDWLLSAQKSIAPRPIDIIRNDIARATGKISFDDYDEYEAENSGTGILYGNNVVKTLLNCWPQSKNLISKQVGITSKNLDWYLTGKKGLEERCFYNLCSYLKLAPDEQFEREDGSPLYELRGNYLLLASDKVAHVDNLVVELTGSDYSYMVEILPVNGNPDPSFRFLLFGRDFDFHFMVFSRSSPSASYIDNETEQLTYDDEDLVIGRVPNKMYLDLLKLFGDVSKGYINPGEINVKILPWIDEIEKISDATSMY